MHRYDGRLIWLTYHGESVVKSLYLVKVRKGSPTTLVGDYIKDGGVMAGMSRHKCGAAGLMETISKVQPAGLKVVVALCMVRNSVGANCYVKDEIITSRTRVGNTGAEGRMAVEPESLVVERMMDSLMDSLKNRTVSMFVVEGVDEPVPEEAGEDLHSG